MVMEASSQTSENPVQVRFSLIPQGELHLVDARIALLNATFAFKERGKFFVQLDDSETDKVTSEKIEPILQDLAWLEILPAPDSIAYHSREGALFEKALQQLREEGLAYPCYCTPQKLEEEKRRFLSQGKTPRYVGTCRDLPEHSKKEFEESGAQPIWRLRNERQIIKYTDAILGDFTVDSETLGDGVLKSANGIFSKDFRTVVLDAHQQITHVIRRENENGQTAWQILIQRALKASTPSYAHIPLILGEDKSLLSKKHGPSTIGELKTEGYFAVPVRHYLLLLGWNPPERRERLSFEEILKRFSLDRIGRQAPPFDYEKLKRFNVVFLRELPDEELLARLPPFIANFDKIKAQKTSEWVHSTLLLLRKDSSTLGELRDSFLKVALPSHALSDASRKALQMKDSAKILKGTAEELKKLEPYTLESLSAFVKGLKEKAGSKAVGFYTPIRIALTGEITGPDLALLFYLLGKSQSLDRIDYALKTLQQPSKK